MTKMKSPIWLYNQMTVQNDSIFCCQDTKGRFKVLGAASAWIKTK